jgi:uncharacterized membrane protein YfhO
LSRTLEAEFPLGEAVVLEQNLEPDSLTGTGQVLETEYDLNRIHIRTRTTGPMLLVVNDRYYPGWRALVNGVEAPVMRAGGTFRAISVPPGDSRVELMFRPSGLRLGAVVSLLGLLALAGLVMSSRGCSALLAREADEGQGR